MSRDGDGDSDRSRKGGGLATRLMLASVCASLSETATFPIDTLKTRLQLRRGRGCSSSSDILRGRGSIRGFYSGLSPAILRHLFYTPLRIVAYENLRDAPASLPLPLSLFAKPLAGGVSGLFAQVLASPADLVKVRMQAHPTLYTGLYDAFSRIIKSHGFFGLWRGVLPNAQRAFLVNMGELACYDHAKQFLLTRNICQDNILAHTLSSVCSGLCASVISCPADVVKTRMMNNSSIYQNSVDCLVRTVRGEGLGALWKGFFPTWARLGPWQFVFWVSYEQFRQLLGLSSF